MARRIKLKSLNVDFVVPARTGFHLFLQQSLILSPPFIFSYSSAHSFHRTFPLCPYPRVFFPLPFCLVNSYSSLAFISVFLTLGKPCLNPPTTSYSLSCIFSCLIWLLNQFLSFHKTVSQRRKGLHLVFCFSTIPVSSECLRHCGKNICWIKEYVTKLEPQSTEPSERPAVVGDLQEMEDECIQSFWLLLFQNISFS